MKKKQIFAIDYTDNKLFFVPDFLHHLNNLDTSVHFCLTEEQQERYDDFLHFFPNIRVVHSESRIPEKAVQIHFADKPVKSFSAGSRQLIYPVLETDALEDYTRVMSDHAENPELYFAPLSRQIKDVKFITGEAIFAADMLKRMIGGNDLRGLKILVSAGPTAEDIDPVRFLTNRSSGKMGIAIARAAYVRGAEVHMVIGPTGQQIPPYLKTSPVRSAADMAEAVQQAFGQADVYIGAAAVADFRPAKKIYEKIKKKYGEMQLQLQRTSDILETIKPVKTKQIIVGFSVETKDELKNSTEKLKKKGLDFIVINNPRIANSAFASETNKVTLLFRDGSAEDLPMLSKLDVGHVILDHIKRIKDA